MSTFPVKTTSELWPLEVMGMGQEPRMREGKATPEGEPTYGTGAVLLTVAKDGSTRPEKTASVHVIKPAAIYGLGDRFIARGRIYVQPYTPDGGRLTYSITVEELIPANKHGNAQPKVGE